MCPYTFQSSNVQNYIRNIDTYNNNVTKINLHVTLKLTSISVIYKHIPNVGITLYYKVLLRFIARSYSGAEY